MALDNLQVFLSHKTYLTNLLHLCDIFFHIGMENYLGIFIIFFLLKILRFFQNNRKKNVWPPTCDLTDCDIPQEGCLMNYGLKIMYDLYEIDRAKFDSYSYNLHNYKKMQEYL